MYEGGVKSSLGGFLSHPMVRKQSAGSRDLDPKLAQALISRGMTSTPGLIERLAAFGKGHHGRRHPGSHRAGASNMVVRVFIPAPEFPPCAAMIPATFPRSPDACVSYNSSRKSRAFLSEPLMLL
jgi:hypothetical protein